MTVALFAARRSVIFGHVGDSRAYLLRDGRLEQLTDDHSLVAELVRRGELSRGRGGGAPAALGDHARARHRSRRRRRRLHRRAQPGDVFLLCSDGLTTMVDADEIAEIVLRHRDDLSAGDERADPGGERRTAATTTSRPSCSRSPRPAKGDTREAPAIVARPRRGRHAASRGRRDAPPRDGRSRPRRSRRADGRPARRHDDRVGRGDRGGRGRGRRRMVDTADADRMQRCAEPDADGPLGALRRSDSVLGRSCCSPA